MRSLGIGLLVIGFFVGGYALTVGVFPWVPRFTFETRLFRWGLFAIGLLSFSVGLAMTIAAVESARE